MDETETSPQRILRAILRERDYQTHKWGTLADHPHTVAEWLLIMESELHEAKQAWVKSDDSNALRELLQVVATGFAAMQQHGVVERIIPQHFVDGLPPEWGRG